MTRLNVNGIICEVTMNEWYRYTAVHVREERDGKFVRVDNLEGQGNDAFQAAFNLKRKVLRAG